MSWTRVHWLRLWTISLSTATHYLKHKFLGAVEHVRLHGILNADQFSFLIAGVVRQHFQLNSACYMHATIVGTQEISNSLLGAALSDPQSMEVQLHLKWAFPLYS